MKLALSLVFVALFLTACTERLIPPSDGPQSVAFELVYPIPTGADYYAVSGVRLVTDEILQDTIIRVSGRSFYAEFRTATGVSLPEKVELNGSPFVRHRDTDTLRLASAESASLFGLQTWRLTSDGTPTTFQSAELQEIDSVLPLMHHEPIRSDTALVLTWRAPTAGSGGMLLTWRAPGIDTYSLIVSDNGRAAIPSSIVSRFSGDSELILTRFRTITETYNGRPFAVTRIAQRNYKVEVFG